MLRLTPSSTGDLHFGDSPQGLALGLHPVTGQDGFKRSRKVRAVRPPGLSLGVNLEQAPIIRPWAHGRIALAIGVAFKLRNIIDSYFAVNAVDY